jgi:L-rhamnose mutarotase
MLANELQKCMQKAKKKMNSLAIKLTGRDIENFTFSSQYGKTLRGNLITDWDDEDEDDDGEDGEHEDLDHSFEETTSDQDPCDLEMLKSLQQANLKDFTNHFKDPSKNLFAFVQLVDDEGNMCLVQKRTLCWFLEEQTRKMSIDHILRVRQLMSFHDSRKLVVKSVENDQL